MFNPNGNSSACTVDLETERPPSNLDQRLFAAFPVLDP